MPRNVTSRSHITYTAASAVIKAGLEKAAELDVNATIMITEGTGEIVAVVPTVGVNPRGWRGGLAKAAVAAGLGVSTEFFLEQRLKQDEALWVGIVQQFGSDVRGRRNPAQGGRTDRWVRGHQRRSLRR